MAGVASGLSVKAWNNKLAKYMREKEHKAKQRTGSKLHHTYGKASRSLEDATEYIDDYAKALKLKGIGDFVAKELEKYIRTEMMSGGGGGGGADDGDGAGGGGAGGGGGGGSGANTVSSGTGGRAKKGGWKGRAKGGGTGSAAAAASAALAASTSASTSQETKKVWDLLGAVHFSQSQSQTQASAAAAAASQPSQPSRRELCAAAALKRAGPVPGLGGEEKENRGGAWGEAGGKGGGGGAGSSDEDEAAMIVISDDEEDGAGDRNRKLPPLAPPMAVMRVPSAASAASASSSHRGGGASPSSSSTSSGAGRKRKAPSGVDPSASASASSQPPPPPLPEPGTLAANGLGSMGIFVPSPLAVGAEEEEEAEEGEGPPCLDHLFNHFGKAGEDWTVVLLLDCREHSNNKQVQSRLHQARIPCDLAALNLGDMTWVARRQRQQPGPQSLMEAAAAAAAAAAATSAGGKKRVGAAAAAQREEAARGEVMLRYLVERKTSADLAASIKDGRYKEQKGRMRGAGNEVDRAFYLIEGALHHQDSGMPATTLRTALANTQVLHGLPVLATDNLDQTIALLARMHRRIEGAFAHFLRAARAGPGSVQRREYLASRLPSLPLPPARVIPFAEYQARCKKSGGERGLDVAAMFARQLRQVPNLGKKQIEAIVAAYPTSASLAGALKGLPKEEALAMLRSLPLPASGRSLGPKSAEMLWLVYK